MKTNDILLIGALFLAYKSGLFRSLLGGGGGTSPTTPTTPSAPSMTSDQACAKAKAALTALMPSFATKSCAEIKTHVCNDPTLFVNRTGDDAGIRAAFGCPLS